MPTCMKDVVRLKATQLTGTGSCMASTKDVGVLGKINS